MSFEMSGQVEESKERPIYKWTVIFVLGLPGAGKGTQCQRLAEAFGMAHLSVGELLRIEGMSAESPYKEVINKHMVEGSIVPTEITCELIEHAIRQRKCCRAFLIDGFPRNEENLNGWMAKMGEKTNVSFVLLFDCCTETSMRRCMSRFEDRSDDNAATLKKRIQNYKIQNVPVIEYFTERNMVQKVDARKHPEEIFAQLKNLFRASGFHYDPLR